jgi:hypothetical protein
MQCMMWKHTTLCAPVHFGGVLAAEGAATMCTPAAISVHDDLAPCQPSVAAGPTHHKAACQQTMTPQEKHMLQSCLRADGNV